LDEKGHVAHDGGDHTRADEEGDRAVTPRKSDGSRAVGQARALGNQVSRALGNQVS
jgi:hypothetical protein